jgi:hypothetical protein
MTRWTAVYALAALAVAAAAPAAAQEKGATPATVEVTINPGGGLFFAGGSTESRFRNYNVGGSVAFNVNDVIGLEAESSLALGVYHQRLVVGNLAMTEAPPNLVDMMGSVTFSVPGGTHHMIPYAAVGVGSLVLLTHTDLGVGASKAFMTASAGGGLKWYANGRWGLRADYRLLTVQSSNGAPEFFGREARIAHRISAGVILNVVE